MSKKIAIYCFSFVEENLRRQPWRFVSELGIFLQKEGHTVVVFTKSRHSVTTSSLVGGINTISVNPHRFYPVLSELLHDDRYSLLFDVQGLLASVNVPRLRFVAAMKIPVVGLLTSPVYHAAEVLALGPRELLRSFRFVWRNLVESLIPSRWIARLVNKTNRATVVLSVQTHDRLVALGCRRERIFVIPPGRPTEAQDPSVPIVAQPDADPHGPSGSSATSPLGLLYLGSPLTIRGTDLALEALRALLDEGIDVRLTMLLRTEYASFAKWVEKLRRMSARLGVHQRVEFIDGVLSADEVQQHLHAADIVLLPFKIVISDFPIAVIESMSLGKVTVSTRVDGISELLDGGRGIAVKPNSAEELARALLGLLRSTSSMQAISSAARNYMERSYPTWKETFEPLIDKINSIESPGLS